MTRIVQVSDGTLDEGFLIYIDPNKQSGREIATIGNAVFEWISDNNLILTEDYLFSSTSSVLFEANDDWLKQSSHYPHGIKIFDKELETAFRLRFLCK